MKRVQLLPIIVTMLKRKKSVEILFSQYQDPSLWLPHSTPLNLICSLGMKLKEFNIFSWKPDISVHGAPIPLYFDYETFEMPLS